MKIISNTYTYCIVDATLPTGSNPPPFFRGRSRESEVEERGGVTYKDEQIKNMMELAAELSVTPPTVNSRLVN